MAETVERFITSGSARLWTCLSGGGTPVLMFNGGPGYSDYLEPVAKLIDDRCRVICFEPRGCGRSDWDGNYTVDTLIQDASSILNAYGVETCIVAGHSFGPDAALAFTLRYPSRVLGLIAMAGGRIVNDRSWSVSYRRGREEVGEDLGGIAFHADERANSDGNRSWQEFIQRPNLLRNIADLSISSTYIFGARDIRPSWPTQQLAALLPKGRYVEIEGAAHHIWLTHSAELQCELRGAIDRVRDR